MTFQLLAHQEEGVAFLRERRSGLLAFEQGLGKTLVAINSFQRITAAGAVDRLLVICPNSLKRNWAAEITKFAPGLTVEIAEGRPVERRGVFLQSAAAVVITSYETARTEVTGILAFLQRQRVVLVLDESHAAKNWRSLTSTAARHFAPHCDYRWLLSGTPVTNTPADLYTQIEILAPGEHLLGSMESFLTMAEADPGAEFARGTLDRLVLRRTKEQCLDLPAKSFVDVRVELPHWQRSLYDEMREQMACEIEGMDGRQYSAYAATALAQLSRLVQLASNPSIVFPGLEATPAKFDALEGLLSDVLSVPSRKVIIWSAYVRSIETLLDRLQGAGAVAIYGGTPPGSRQDVAQQFQEDPETRVLIANPAAAATGFTLTAASYAVYESMSWRYDHYAQSQDRNHRIGQGKPVTYMRLIAADTIEEAIVSALGRKSALARSLLGDRQGGGVTRHLTQAEMCGLLRTNRLPDPDVLEG